MKVIIPINGTNERMGSLFKTPKHLLLYKGKPIIEHILDFFGGVDIIILTNEDYFADLEKYIDGDISVWGIRKTESQVDTLNLLKIEPDTDVMFVDCDIVPVRLKTPNVNMVYVFENKLKDKQYSNFDGIDGRVSGCNEKEEVCQYAGAGIYYFRSYLQFIRLSKNCKSISQVIAKMIQEDHVWIDVDNEIVRLGTLKDITS